jgi:hypothetical protein
MVGVRRAEEIFPPQIEGEQVKLTIRPALPSPHTQEEPGAGGNHAGLAGDPPIACHFGVVGVPPDVPNDLHTVSLSVRERNGRLQVPQPYPPENAVIPKTAHKWLTRSAVEAAAVARKGPDPVNGSGYQAVTACDGMTAR